MKTPKENKHYFQLYFQYLDQLEVVCIYTHSVHDIKAPMFANRLNVPVRLTFSPPHQNTNTCLMCSNKQGPPQYVGNIEQTDELPFKHFKWLMHRITDTPTVK